MKKIIYILFFLIHAKAFAQVPEDAIRYGWYPQNGTARNMAIGGAMGSLGGDITSVFVNPAGIGFYKTSEFVFTPSILFNNNKATYRDNITANKQSAFNLGPTGLIFGEPIRRNPKNSHAISIALNQLVSFNNNVSYNGLNNYSSFSEQFAEEFANSGYTINEALQSNSPVPYGSATALYTYLIDTATINGNIVIKAAPEYLLDSGYALQQEMNKRTGGGMYELALTYAHNIKDKFLFGATIGIPYLNYKSNTTFTETDTSGNVYNHFKSFSYNDNFKTNGVGFNLKIGVIYKPTDHIRLGLAVHTPSFLLLTDTRTTSLISNLETPTGQSESFAITSQTFTNNKKGESKYTQRAPWKAILSASYVFREIENVKKQRGFITADIEYVNQRSSRFSSDNEIPTQTEKIYYSVLNNVVKQEYKGAFNFRVGGELKFNIIMARLGFAYYSNPYKDAALKANQMLLSGGLGYRNKGFFVDLTYVHRTKKDISFPYRLEDRVNTFANLKQQQGNLVATVGVKF